VALATVIGSPRIETTPKEGEAVPRLDPGHRSLADLWQQASGRTEWVAAHPHRARDTSAAEW